MFTWEERRAQSKKTRTERILVYRVGVLAS